MQVAVFRNASTIKQVLDFLLKFRTYSSMDHNLSESSLYEEMRLQHMQVAWVKNAATQCGLANPRPHHCLFQRIFLESSSHPCSFFYWGADNGAGGNDAALAQLLTKQIAKHPQQAKLMNYLHISLAWVTNTRSTEVNENQTKILRRCVRNNCKQFKVVYLFNWKNQQPNS